MKFLLLFDYKMYKWSWNKQHVFSQVSNPGSHDNLVTQLPSTAWLIFDILRNPLDVLSDFIRSAGLQSHLFKIHTKLCRGSNSMTSSKYAMLNLDISGEVVY